MGAHLRMLSAFEQAISGWGFHRVGTEQMAATRSFLDSLAARPPAELATMPVAEAIVASAAPAILTIARAAATTRAALESLEIEGGESLGYLCSLPNARRLATSYASAASANLSYFESLFVQDLSNLLGVPYDTARAVLMSREPDYLVATMAFQMQNLDEGLPAALKKQWGPQSLSWALGTLAGSILSYFKTSLLISEWYSLDVKVDPITGQPTAVGYEKAFINMLGAAERKAREHARAAKVATGTIPVQARLSYQTARVLRTGDLADRLHALELYWASSVYSQTAVMLARNG
jgi:hypothetical protein